MPTNNLRRFRVQGATGTLWGNGTFKNNLSIKAEGFTVLSKDNQ